MANCLTKEGLPIVLENTFLDFVREYPIASENNDPEVTQRIKDENPQIYRLMKIGMDESPSREARSYYEMGCQITYELLRRQSLVNLKK